MRIPGLSQRDGWWYYRAPQVDGIRPPRVALGTRVESEAITKALELRAQSSVEISRGRLSGEVQRYLTAKLSAGQFTRATHQATSSTLKQLTLYLDNPIASTITRRKIEAWRAHLIGEEKPDSSVKTYLRRAQGLFSWLEKEGKILETPFKGLRVGKIRSTKAVTYCTRIQRDQVLDACDREDLRFVLMAGFFLGLRRIEIIEAVPAWFRSPGVVEVTETPTFKPKDKERRSIHYGRRFAEYLEGYGHDDAWPFMLLPDKHHGKARYRWDSTRPMRKLADAVGMPWLRHHTLRHTFATLHVQAGTPLPTVADWLGDSYQVTHEHYVAHAPNQAHVGNLD